MSPLVALVFVVSLVAVATVAGVVATRRSGRARRVASTVLDTAALGIDEIGEEATLVLFKTEFCSRCPSVGRMLRTVADAADGVGFAEVDLTHRPEAASALRILQTPTTFVLDGAGQVRARFGGVVTKDAVTQQLAEITGVSHVLV
jgi:thioredoxin-like negative regulator of GroEL